MLPCTFVRMRMTKNECAAFHCSSLGLKPNFNEQTVARRASLSAMIKFHLFPTRHPMILLTIWKLRRYIATYFLISYYLLKNFSTDRKCSNQLVQEEKQRRLSILLSQEPFLSFAIVLYCLKLYFLFI